MADDDGEFNVEEEESEDNVSDDGSEHSTGSYDSDQIFNFLEGIGHVCGGLKLSINTVYYSFLFFLLLSGLLLM